MAPSESGRLTEPVPRFRDLEITLQTGTKPKSPFHTPVPNLAADRRTGETALYAAMRALEEKAAMASRIADSVTAPGPWKKRLEEGPRPMQRTQRFYEK